MNKAEAERIVAAMKVIVDGGFKVGTEAALEGGNRAGAYLDQIGKTDLAALSAEEWATFCNILLGGALIHGLTQILPSDICPF